MRRQGGIYDSVPYWAPRCWGTRRTLPRQREAVQAKEGSARFEKARGDRATVWTYGGGNAYVGYGPFPENSSGTSALMAAMFRDTEESKLR